MNAERKSIRSRVFGSCILLMMVILAVCTVTFTATAEEDNSSYSLIIRKVFSFDKEIPQEVREKAQSQEYTFKISGTRSDKGETVEVNETFTLPRTVDGQQVWESQKYTSDGPFNVTVIEVTDNVDIKDNHGRHYNMSDSSTDTSVMINSRKHELQLRNNAILHITRPGDVDGPERLWYHVSNRPYDGHSTDGFAALDMTFSLTKGEDRRISVNPATKEGLCAGVYTFEQIAAPDGYQLQLGKRTETVTNGNKGYFYINGTPGSLTLTAGGTKGDGATHIFTVERTEPGDTLEYVTRSEEIPSGESRVFDDLPKGGYTVTEYSYTGDVNTEFSLLMPQTVEKKRDTTTTAPQYTTFRTFALTPGTTYFKMNSFGPLYDVNKQKINSTSITYNFAYGWGNENGGITYSTVVGTFKANEIRTITNATARRSHPDKFVIGFRTQNVSDSKAKHLGVSWTEYTEKDVSKTCKNAGTQYTSNIKVDDRGWMTITAPAPKEGTDTSHIVYYYAIRNNKNELVTGVGGETDNPDTTVMLKAGESVKLEGLAAGSYKVMETVGWHFAGFTMEIEGYPFGTTEAEKTMNVQVGGQRELTISKPAVSNPPGEAVDERDYIFTVSGSGFNETVSVKAGESTKITLPKEGKYTVQPQQDKLTAYGLKYVDSSAIYGTASGSVSDITFTNIFSQGEYGYRYVHEYYVRESDGGYAFEGNSDITTRLGRKESERYQSTDIRMDSNFKGNEYTHFGEAYGWVDPLTPEASDEGDSAKKVLKDTIDDEETEDSGDDDSDTTEGEGTEDSDDTSDTTDGEGTEDSDDGTSDTTDGGGTEGSDDDVSDITDGGGTEGSDDDTSGSTDGEETGGSDNDISDTTDGGETGSPDKGASDMADGDMARVSGAVVTNPVYSRGTESFTEDGLNLPGSERMETPDGNASEPSDSAGTGTPGEGTQDPPDGEGTETPGEGTQDPPDGEGTETPGEGTQDPSDSEGTQTPEEDAQDPDEDEEAEAPDKDAPDLADNEKPEASDVKTKSSKPLSLVSYDNTGIIDNGVGLDSSGTPLNYAPETDKDHIVVTKEAEQIIIMRYYRERQPAGKYNVIHVYYRRDENGEEHWEGTSGVRPQDGELGIKYSGDQVARETSFKPEDAPVPYDYIWDMRPQYGELAQAGNTGSYDPETDKYEFAGDGKVYRPNSDWTAVEGTEEGNQIIILRYYRDPNKKGLYNIVHEYYFRENGGSDSHGQGNSVRAQTEDSETGEEEEDSSGTFGGTLNKNDGYVYTYEGGYSNMQHITALLGHVYTATVNDQKPEYEGNDYIYIDAGYGTTSGQDGRYSYDPNQQWAAATEEGDEVIILRYYRKAGYKVVHEYYVRNKKDAEPELVGKSDIREVTDVSDEVHYTQEDVNREPDFQGETYTYYDCGYGTVSGEGYSEDPGKQYVEATGSEEQIIILRYVVEKIPEEPEKPSTDPKPPRPPKNPEPPKKLPDPEDPNTSAELSTPKAMDVFKKTSAPAALNVSEEPATGIDYVPETGDDSRTALWMVLTVGSLCGLAILSLCSYVYRKRKDRQTDQQ